MLADELDYVLGVDTHRDEHVLSIVTAPAGAVVAGTEAPANLRGYRELLRVAARHAPGRRAWAIEGTGSYGAGLARFLAGRGEVVLEVSRVPRTERRLRGKDDALDAARTARAALASETLTLPRAGERREALRLLLIARRSAVDGRREALTQLRAVIVTAPEPLRQQLRGLPLGRLLDRCSRLRRSNSASVDAVQRPNTTTPTQPRRRPPTQPRTAHDRAPPPPTRSSHPGLRRRTNRSRQEPTRRQPTPQALPRPPPLPTTSTNGGRDDLTSHRSIIPHHWRSSEWRRVVPGAWNNSTLGRRMRSSGQFVPVVDLSALPWLSVEQMREVDRIMVEDLGISLPRMMENAGRNLAELARHLMGGDTGGQAVAVLVGPGGNGGGGLVAARHLAATGAHVEIALAAEKGAFAPVPAEQLAIARRLRIPVHRRPDALGEPALVLDALLGYSQRGDPRGDAADLIRWSSGKRVLALDVPSGLELTSGELRTPHVVAQATMTLAAPKTALREPGAAEATGRLFLADISVPGLVYEALGLNWQTPFTRGPLVELDVWTAAKARGEDQAFGDGRERFRHNPTVNDDRSTRIAALLHEAGETHHTVFRISDGDDPDWASWYADWLTHLSELPQIVESTPVRSELTWLLVSLDKEYTAARPETPWPQWYAERILRHFSSTSA